MWSLSVGTVGQSSGPYTYTATALPTEPALQPLALKYLWHPAWPLSPNRKKTHGEAEREGRCLQDRDGILRSGENA